MGIELQDDPDIFDFHIHLDERHTPDPIQWTDWVILSYALITILVMIFGNMILFIVKNRSPIVRSKNLTILFLMTFAAIVHITAVLMNEIFRPPERVIVENIELNKTDNGFEVIELSFDSDDSDSDGNSLEFFHSNISCVVMFFWMEMFFGLSFYLALLMLRLQILTHCIANDVEVAIAHLRKKTAIRLLYVALFLLPMYMLCLFISVRGLAKFALFPIEPAQKERELEILSDNQTYQYHGTLHKITCETALIYKIILISILLFYVCYIMRLARIVSKSDFVVDYSSSAVHIVIFAVPAIVVAGLLNFMHTLTYAIGRDLFVVIVISLHLFSYLRIALPGLGSYIYKHTCDDNQPEDDAFDDLMIIQNRAELTRKREMRSLHVTVESLSSNNLVAQLFYEYAIDTEKDTRYVFVKLSNSIDHATLYAKYDPDLIKNIVSCIRRLEVMEKLIKGMYKKTHESDIHGNPGIDNTSLLLQIQDVDFSLSEPSELESISLLGKDIYEEYFCKKQGQKKKININDKTVEGFALFGSSKSKGNWTSDSLFKVKHTLQIALVNRFSNDFSKDPGIICKLQEQTKRDKKKIINLVDLGLVSKETLMKIAADIQGGEACFANLFGDDFISEYNESNTNAKKNLSSVNITRGNAKDFTLESDDSDFEADKEDYMIPKRNSDELYESETEEYFDNLFDDEPRIDITTNSNIPHVFCCCVSFSVVSLGDSREAQEDSDKQFHNAINTYQEMEGFQHTEKFDTGFKKLFDEKIVRTKEGHFLYPSFFSAFTHFWYHLYLWIILPLHKWGSIQWVCKSLRRIELSRRLCIRCCPGFWGNIIDELTPRSSNVVKLLDE